DLVVVVEENRELSAARLRGEEEERVAEALSAGKLRRIALTEELIDVQGLREEVVLYPIEVHELIGGRTRVDETVAASRLTEGLAVLVCERTEHVRRVLPLEVEVTVRDDGASDEEVEVDRPLGVLDIAALNPEPALLFLAVVVASKDRERVAGGQRL